METVEGGETSTIRDLQRLDRVPDHGTYLEETMNQFNHVGNYKFRYWSRRPKIGNGRLRPPIQLKQNNARVKRRLVGMKTRKRLGTIQVNTLRHLRHRWELLVTIK